MQSSSNLLLKIISLELVSTSSTITNSAARINVGTKHLCKQPTLFLFVTTSLSLYSVFSFGSPGPVAKPGWKLSQLLVKNAQFLASNCSDAHQKYWVLLPQTWQQIFPSVPLKKIQWFHISHLAVTRPPSAPAPDDRVSSYTCNVNMTRFGKMLIRSIWNKQI